jgi:hypothetical protein
MLFQSFLRELADTPRDDAAARSREKIWTTGPARNKKRLVCKVLRMTHAMGRHSLGRALSFLGCAWLPNALGD